MEALLKVLLQSYLKVFGDRGVTVSLALITAVLIMVFGNSHPED